MATFGSTLYTIGTALDRAQQEGHVVELLLEGHWVKGTVMACDGTGVVLEGIDEDHMIVRLDKVAAVKVNSEYPLKRRIRGGQVPEQGGGIPADDRVDGAMPMPAPH